MLIWHTYVSCFCRLYWGNIFVHNYHGSVPLWYGRSVPDLSRQLPHQPVDCIVLLVMYFEDLFRVQEVATSTTLHVGLSRCLLEAGREAKMRWNLPKWGFNWHFLISTVSWLLVIHVSSWYSDRHAGYSFFVNCLPEIIVQIIAYLSMPQSAVDDRMGRGLTIP
jgi:hypothetical protein